MFTNSTTPELIHSKEPLSKIPTFLEDTAHCLRFLEESNQIGLSEDCFPVTVDVTALYTNIPAEGPDGGLEAFEKALETREEKMVPSWYLKALLQQVLNSNIFEFNGQLWRQFIGTAMGTMLASTYASLFMSELEQKNLNSWEGTKPLLFKRLIDDIFFCVVRY